MNRIKVIATAGVLSMAGSASAQLPISMPDSYYVPARACPAVQSSVLKQTYTFTCGASEIALVRYERADANSEWKRFDGSYTTSYMITSFCSREGGDDVFVAGMNDEGTCVLERWVFELPPGRQAVRFGPPPPIGEPQNSYIPAIVITGGGNWVPPGQFERYPQPRRGVLYSGNTGPFTAMAVDPEGRQLLLYDRSSLSLKTLRLDTSPSTFTTVFANADYSQLSQIASIEVRDFATEGRKYLLRRMYGDSFPMSQEVYGIISDSNNDGVLGPLAFYDRTQLLATPYSNWSDWKLFWLIP